MSEFIPFPIENYRPQYLSAIPIETPYGRVRFLTLKEHIELASEINYMSMNILHIYYQLIKLYGDLIEDDFKQLKLYEYVESELGTPFKEAYRNVFTLVLGDVDIVEQILLDEDAFMDMRNIVCDMNIIKEERVSKNPELQKGYEEDRLFKSLDKDDTTLDDIASSIAVYVGWSYDVIYSNTIYQIYTTYNRISNINNFEASILFKTVDSDYDIVPWSKHVDMFEKEKFGMKFSDFQEKFGNLMKA